MFGILSKKNVGINMKEAQLFVYCLSGGRSSQACGWMRNNGYTDVTNIGGISSRNGSIVRG